MFLGSLKELVRQGGDERMKKVHGAEYLLGFGCVLGRVVDALVGSTKAMAMGGKNRIKSDLKVFLELKTSNQSRNKRTDIRSVINEAHPQCCVTLIYSTFTMPARFFNSDLTMIRFNGLHSL